MKLFTNHPKEVGETYIQHFYFAATFGFRMMIGGCACLLHAIFPFIFKKTGSNMLISMMQHFVERMPAAEERVIVLSQTIEKKITTHAGN